MSGPVMDELRRLAVEVRDASAAHKVAAEALRKASEAQEAARDAKRIAANRYDAAQTALAYFAANGKHDPREAAFAGLRMSEPRDEAST